MIQSPLLQNVFGTIGTVLWSAQIIPQIYQNYKTKSTYGLSSYLMLLWTLSALFLGVYNILQNINVALIVQPQSFGVLGAVCWVQCLYYGDGPEPEETSQIEVKQKWRKTLSLRSAWAVFLLYLLIAVGFECGMVFGIRAAARTHGGQLNHAGVQFFGVTSAVLISAGLIPQYFEIYRLGRVVGVSYTFMVIDTFGGVFSLLSLAFKETWDVTASITYILVIVLDSVVLLLAMILNPLARRREARAKAEAENSEAQECEEVPSATNDSDQEKGLSSSPAENFIRTDAASEKRSFHDMDQISNSDAESIEASTITTTPNELYHFNLQQTHNPHGV